MFPTLFSPFSLKGLTLRNRIASTPHSDGMAEDGLVTERLIAYFQAKAVGGVGLVMGPAGCAVHPTSPTRAGGLELYRPEAMDGLARLVRTVHAAGAAYIPQLTHWGRRGNSPLPKNLWVALGSATHRRTSNRAIYREFSGLRRSQNRP